MAWKPEKEEKIPSIKSPILIAGLPGIGNVGKIAVDFLIEEFKAKKIYTFFSYDLPNTVFVNEQNMVSLPEISLYHAKIQKNDLLLLAGDVQPGTDDSSFEFCDTILDIFKSMNGKEIITIGGIGLQDIPKKPKVYCTGNSKEIIKKYTQETNAKTQLFGVVGPIMGVTGLLLGMSKRKNIQAASFLAETFGHPLYLGIAGSKEVIKILDKKLSLKVDIKQLEKEIKDIESEMLKRTKELTDITKQSALNKLKEKFDDSYIG